MAWHDHRRRSRRWGAGRREDPDLAVETPADHDVGYPEPVAVVETSPLLGGTVQNRGRDLVDQRGPVVLDVAGRPVHDAPGIPGQQLDLVQGGEIADRSGGDEPRPADTRCAEAGRVVLAAPAPLPCLAGREEPPLG